MTTTYDYSTTTDFTSSNINITTLQDEIKNDVDIGIAPEYIEQVGDIIHIYFPSSLSNSQKAKLDTLIATYIYIPIVETKSIAYQAIVDAKGDGDFKLVSEAFDSGALSVYVKNGVYVETKNINMPDGSQLIGEASSKVIIYFVGPYGIRIDGSGGITETTGTFSLLNNSDQVIGVNTLFTNLSVGTFFLIGTNYFVIQSIESDTSLTLSKIYEGTIIVNGNVHAQAMSTGNRINNMVITNASGLGTGIYVRATRHGSFQDIAIDGFAQNVEFIESGDISTNSLISVNSKDSAMIINSCMSMAFSIVNIFNCISHGIVISGTSTNIVIESSASENNGGSGIYITDTSNQVCITDAVVRYNNNKGINITTSTNSVSINSTTITNSNGDAIYTTGNTTIISGCFINNNSGNGIVVGQSTVLTGNQITNNGIDGITIPIGKTRCIGNGNKVRGNGGVGINILGSEIVLDCNVVKGSVGNAINLGGSDNILCDIIISQNEGKGIYVTGNDCIISTNRVLNTIGIGCEVEIGATDNIISGNNFKGNTGINFINNGTGTTDSLNKY